MKPLLLALPLALATACTVPAVEETPTTKPQQQQAARPAAQKPVTTAAQPPAAPAPGNETGATSMADLGLSDGAGDTSGENRALSPN